jgi:glycosyltransferase involved in cell wall biosynthesis
MTQKFTFHVVGLPHTSITRDFTACAFTEKVRKFAIMMKRLGHVVYTYGGPESESPADEHIPCITEEERLEVVGQNHYVMASFDYNLPHWRKFNANIISGIRERLSHKDFICVIGGYAHKEVADAFPDEMTVEFGIGYGGTFAKYRVFESYAWMHTVYGSANSNPNSIDGNFFDAVVPGYIDIEEFPFRETPDDYYLFVGRLIERKGYQIAVEACKLLGKRLLIAGQGVPPEYGEYVGVVGSEERAKLMGGAIATFAPTTYIEPFGTVAPEAMACGTPVITTDWGAFTETVIDGKTGFRCRSLQEFVDATEKVKDLDRFLIRQHSVDNYSLESIAEKYQIYFNRLHTLWEDGWYQLK